MKRFLQILIVGIVVAIATGYYLKNTGNHIGETVIGVSVITIAFVFMPLFIYHRYKGRDLKNFTIIPPKDEEETK